MHRTAEALRHEALRHDTPRNDALRHDAPPEDAPRSESWPNATPGTDAPPSPSFPGCRSFQLTRDAVEHYEGRFEYWTPPPRPSSSWPSRPAGTHETPSRRLSAFGEVIASIRGGPIECCGSMDLIWNAGQRERRRILQADELAYLYPAPRPPPQERTRHRRARPARRRARGRPHHRRPPRQARPVRRVGLPRSVGRGARRDVALPPGGAGARTDHPPPRYRPLPDGGGERRPSRLDGGRDPCRAQRADPLGRDRPRAEARRPRPWARATARDPRTPRGSARSATKKAGSGTGRRRAGNRPGTRRGTSATVPPAAREVRRRHRATAGNPAGGRRRPRAPGAGRRLDHRVRDGGRAARPRRRRPPAGRLTEPHPTRATPNVSARSGPRRTRAPSLLFLSRGTAAPR